MAERKVDRSIWAHKIALLIEQETNGNKSAFARKVGLASARTIDRWLARQVDVSEESVRQVARALSLPLGETLVELGLLDASDVVAPIDRRLAEDEEAAKLVRGATDLPPAVRRDILKHLTEQRAEHERQRKAEIERLLEMARRSRGRTS